MIILALGAVVLPVVIRYLLPGLGMVLSAVAYLLCCGLDHLFSTRLVPQAPWTMWVFWGGVLGAAFGFWTVAPRYGLRHRRSLILLLPFPLMLLLALLTALFCR